jgi:hypothetical protein
MSRKNTLLGYPWLNANAAVAQTSQVTQIQFLDNVGIQTDLVGATLAGSIDAQVSANFARDNQGNVTNPGTWVTLATQAITAGQPTTTYMDLNQLSAPWIRLVWTRTAGTGTITSIITAKML